jgi:hypothetical protein
MDRSHQTPLWGRSGQAFGGSLVSQDQHLPDRLHQAGWGAIGRFADIQ